MKLLLLLLATSDFVPLTPQASYYCPTFQEVNLSLQKKQIQADQWYSFQSKGMTFEGIAPRQKVISLYEILGNNIPFLSKGQLVTQFSYTCVYLTVTGQKSRVEAIIQPKRSYVSCGIIDPNHGDSESFLEFSYVCRDPKACPVVCHFTHQPLYNRS
jgi:hypothetical protein